MQVTERIIKELTENKVVKFGKIEYYLDIELPIIRYMEAEKLVPKIAHGANWDQVLQDYEQMFSFATTGSEPLNALFNIAQVSRNRLDGIKDFLKADRINDVLMFCALHLNEKDEDRAQWDEGTATRKIAHWKTVNIPMSVFFSLCSMLIRSLAKSYLGGKKGKAK